METTLDVRFHRCPLPVLKTRKALEGLPSGTVLTVIATDPAARIDMAHFCATAGHMLLSVEEAGAELRFVIERRERPGQPPAFYSASAGL